MKIHRTKDYKTFKFMGSRDISEMAVKKLAKAIKEENLLELFPIVCTRSGKSLYVKDGQHRLMAAIHLRVPIYYIVIEGKMSTSTIAKVADKNRPWKPVDYMMAYANDGRNSYKELKKFVDDTGIPVCLASALMSNGSYTQQSYTKTFRNGELKITDKGFAYEVAKMINVFRKKGFNWTTQQQCVLAISQILKIPDFDIDRLEKKLKYMTNRFYKCAEWKQYIDLIDDIYNHNCRPEQLISLKTEVKKLRATG